VTSAREEECFSGARLRGDDAVGPALEQWFAAESEGFADLGPSDADAYGHSYAALDWYYGFRHLPQHRWSRVLGYGSAYGHELLPIVDAESTVTIVDPSRAFNEDTSALKGHVHEISYVRPVVSGVLPLEDASFDLITAFSVLHHVANVSFVVRELARVLAPGGWALLREPCHSMGDWRAERRGLTQNERGIPFPLFRRFLEDAGLEIVVGRRMNFAPLDHMPSNKGVWNTRWLMPVDAALSRLSSVNKRYHAVNTWQKIRPAASAFVVRKH
jgi:SAM-dependent methyltransferase